MSQQESIHLPTELIENVARGKCVLFLGADHGLGSPALPTRRQLATDLSRRYPDLVDPDQTLARAAGQFLSRRPQDKHSLITFLKDVLGSASSRKPTEVHRAIVGLAFDAVVTAWYDDLMEDAYNEKGKRVALVVSGIDVAYTSTGEDVILLKLYGDLNREETLVITHKDMMRVEGNLAQRLEDVRPFVRLRPIIVLGWDPSDERLLRLYLTATEVLGEHKRRNFIVWPNANQTDIDEWSAENVDIIDAEPLPFLEKLKEAVERQRLLEGMPVYRPGEVVGKLPYKFLDFFDPEDRDIFCGREVEAPLLFRKVLSYPLLTVFGQSGVGKTSLLRAGIVPLLLSEGYDYLYVRALGDPLLAIRQATGEALKVESTGDGTLLDFFLEALGADGRLVVMLDQFEELYTGGLSRATRQRFWREVGACLDMRSPEVHFIVSLREDFLPHLDEARRPPEEGQAAPVPYIMDGRNSYRVLPLDADTAYLAIMEPARRANCEVEPALADVLLARGPSTAETVEEEEQPQWSLVEADGRVPPPSLQIVMDRLYREALARAGHQPPAEGESGRSWRPPQLTLGLDLYRELGGAGRILGEYVTEALKEGVPKRGGDPDLASSLLKAMVTAQKTKAALDETEMIEELSRMAPEFDPDEDVHALRVTRAALVDLRLVRSFQMGDRALYELAHDHMATEIAKWISEEELAAKATAELLKRELDSWQTHGLLIGPEALRLIHEQRDSLRRLKPDELELIFRSALATGLEVPYWFQRAQMAGVAVGAIARENVRSDHFRVRAAAVTTLAQLGEEFADDLVAALADLYPQVRMAAIAALERLRPDGAWRKHLKYECYVPAGSFIMGDDKGAGDETPAHEVYLDAFYIGKYPVTNAEYERYMDDVNQPFDIPEGKADHPVDRVSWYSARNYAAWAGMRLLTEAEWEKAASWDPRGMRIGSQGSGGKKREYPWGDTFDKDKCNTRESRIGATTPVGKYSPAGDSPYGVADMAGNVREWVADWYGSGYYKTSPAANPQGPDSGTDRVVRGGSWYVDRYKAQCAHRSKRTSSNQTSSHGIRVGMSLKPRSLQMMA